jgi:hypothetical protein
MTISQPNDYDKPAMWGASSLVRRNGNVYRVKDASQGPSNIQGTASQYSTIGQINASFGDTFTIGDVNTYYNGKTIKQINVKPLKNSETIGG